MKYCMQCGSILGIDMIQGVQRLRCSNKKCQHIFWQNPIPVVAALVEYEDQVLLARNIKWPSGLLSVISGFLEQNETPEEGIRRELMEELGLNAKHIHFLAYHSLMALNQLILLFQVEAWGEIKLGEELAEYILVDKFQLKAAHFGELQKLDNTIRHQAEAFRDWVLSQYHPQ